MVDDTGADTGDNLNESEERPATVSERGASKMDAEFAESDMDEEDRSILRSTMFSTALSEAGFERPMVLTWQMARRVMTEKRLEILNALGSDHEIESHRALARHLDRNVSDVQDDLDILYEVGVIEHTSSPQGTATKPELATQTLVVNPILVNGEHLPGEVGVTTDTGTEDDEDGDEGIEQAKA